MTKLSYSPHIRLGLGNALGSVTAGEKLVQGVHSTALLRSRALGCVGQVLCWPAEACSMPHRRLGCPCAAEGAASECVPAYKISAQVARTNCWFGKRPDRGEWRSAARRAVDRDGPRAARQSAARFTISLSRVRLFPCTRLLRKSSSCRDRKNRSGGTSGPLGSFAPSRGRRICKFLRFDSLCPSESAHSAYELDSYTGSAPGGASNLSDMKIIAPTMRIENTARA